MLLISGKRDFPSLPHTWVEHKVLFPLFHRIRIETCWLAISSCKWTRSAIQTARLRGRFPTVIMAVLRQRSGERLIRGDRLMDKALGISNTGLSGDLVHRYEQLHLSRLRWCGAAGNNEAGEGGTKQLTTRRLIMHALDRSASILDATRSRTCGWALSSLMTLSCMKWRHSCWTENANLLVKCVQKARAHNTYYGRSRSIIESPNVKEYGIDVKF